MFTTETPLEKFEHFRLDCSMKWTLAHSSIATVSTVLGCFASLLVPPVGWGAAMYVVGFGSTFIGSNLRATNGLMWKLWFTCLPSVFLSTTLCWAILWGDHDPHKWGKMIIIGLGVSFFGGVVGRYSK